MKLKRKNTIRHIITTLVVLILMGGSVAFGVGYSKQITAWYYNIQVKLDGRALNFSKEPFIYDGSIYIPLRDVSQNMGLKVTWNNETKTVDLKSNNMYNVNPNYNNPYDYTNTTNDSYQDVEDDLNSKYDEYTKGEDDLEFEYDLLKQSSSIKVKMKGKNFKKDSTDWEKRDDGDFRDFAEDIAKDVAEELDKDVKLYVYDKNEDTVAKYEYDESKSKFEVVSEYSDEVDLEDLEDEIEGNYEEYTEGSDDLEFDYSLSKTSSYIKVKMNGKNFEISSSKWTNRDEDDFQSFVKDIVDEIHDAIDDEDIRIYVYDDDDDGAAKYIYDESKDKFTVEFEYGDAQDNNTLENELNQNHKLYTNGSSNLEFVHNVLEYSSSVKIEMKSDDFEADSSAWENRDDGKFQEFIKGVAQKAESQTNKDVKIYVYDKDDMKVGEYDYDEGQNSFKVEYEYDEDQVFDEIESKLEDDYSTYEDGSDDLRFDYEVSKASNDIVVKVEGKNFDKKDSEWNDRNDDDFEDFIENIAEEVCDFIDDTDVEITVYDDDNDKVIEYFYDESKDELDEEWEYGED